MVEAEAQLHILSICNFIGQLWCVIIVAGHPFCPRLRYPLNFTHRGSALWSLMKLLENPMPTEFEFKSFFVDLFSFQMYSESGVASVEACRPSSESASSDEEKQKPDRKAKQGRMKQDIILYNYFNLYNFCTFAISSWKYLLNMSLKMESHKVNH